MRLLSLAEVLALHRLALSEHGGSAGLRDRGGLESAIAQPQMSFGGEDLYPSLVEKAAALGFSLLSNHPFIDGNKRVAHAAIEVFLILNGFEIRASVPDAEQLILRLAAGEYGRERLVEWLKAHVVPHPSIA